MGPWKSANSNCRFEVCYSGKESLQKRALYRRRDLFIQVTAVLRTDRSFPAEFMPVETQCLRYGLYIVTINAGQVFKTIITEPVAAMVLQKSIHLLRTRHSAGPLRREIIHPGAVIKFLSNRNLPGRARELKKLPSLDCAPLGNR